MQGHILLTFIILKVLIVIILRITPLGMHVIVIVFMRDTVHIFFKKRIKIAIVGQPQIHTLQNHNGEDPQIPP